MTTGIHLEKLDMKHSRQRNKFLNFYYRLMQDQVKWVPPFRILQKQIIHPEKNPFLRTNTHAFYLVKSESKAVGRFAIFGPGVRKDQPETASFGFIDFEKEFAAKVLSLLKEEAVRLNAQQLIGPMNPNIHYDIGTLSKGFDQSNYIMMNYNPSYYTTSFEQAGFGILKYFHTWSLWKRNFRIDGKLEGTLKIIQQRSAVVIRKAKLSEFNNELKIFHQLYNHSFKTHWGFQSISPEEFRFIAGDLKFLIKSEMALVAEVDNNPVGFVLSIPNLNELIRKSRNGRLSLKLIFKLLFLSRKIKTVRVMLVGVLPEFRGRGIDLMLFHQIATNIFELGFEGGEIAWVMEGNKSVEHNLIRIGASREKEYRLYQINLAE